MLHYIVTGCTGHCSRQGQDREQVSEMDVVASSLASWNKATLDRSLLRVPLHESIRRQITAEDSIYTTERGLPV